jgi:hypothetical protein
VGTSGLNGSVQVVIPSRNEVTIFRRQDVRLLNLNIKPISNEEKERLINDMFVNDKIEFKTRDINNNLSKKKISTDELINEELFDDIMIQEPSNVHQEKSIIDKKNW